MSTPKKELTLQCAVAKLLLALVWLHHIICLANCHVCMQRLVKPENYSALDPPRRPTVVNVKFFLMNLEGIDEARQKFEAQMWVNLSLIDERLSGLYPLKENCS